MLTILRNHGKIVCNTTGCIVVWVSLRSSAAFFPFHNFKVSMYLLLIFYYTDGATNFKSTAVRPNHMHYLLQPDGLDLDLKTTPYHGSSLFK